MPISAVPIAHEQARDQPSRLLLPKHRTVPFSGRAAELRDIAEWFAPASGSLSVRMLHAPAGHGKTRLAEHVATLSAEAGWDVWRIENARGAGAPPPANLSLSAAGGVFVVIDYADRWPPSLLLTLMNHLRGLTLRAGIVVRVLMLARSVGFWWHSVAERIEADFEIGSTAMLLEPLAGESVADRADTFGDAAVAFAHAMDIPNPSSPEPHIELDAPEFGSVLTIHMAALVAVDARRRGDRAPSRPHALSAYLLHRERARWHELHTRVEAPRSTSPTAMGRALYTSTLTGALPRGDARAALRRVELAGTVPVADRIIDDHRFCYPPDSDSIALTGLHPDRLGEDLIALSSPGHEYSETPDGWTPDEWTAGAVAAVLNDADDAGPAPWTHSALAVLVETAYRWRHVSSDVLQPLLLRAPGSALAAGGPALIRLTGLPDVGPAVFEAIDALLPEGHHADLELAAAAVADRLVEHRLAVSADPAERAEILASLAQRLAQAGRFEDAVSRYQQAIVIQRRSTESDPRGHQASVLATMLNGIGLAFAGLGRQDEGLAAVEEALMLLRQSTEPERDRSDLAAALVNLGARMSDAGRPAEAIEYTREAVEILRQLTIDGTDSRKYELATALDNLGISLSDFGRLEDAMRTTREALALRRELATANPASYQQDLGRTQNNMVMRLYRSRRLPEALEAAAEAVRVFTAAATKNPAVVKPMLAAALGNQALILGQLGRFDDAYAPLEETLAIRRELADQNAAAHLSGLGAALIGLGLWQYNVGDHDKSFATLGEAVDIYRRLITQNSDAHSDTLASALVNLGTVAYSVGRPDVSARSTEEAVEILRRLSVANPAGHRVALAAALTSLGGWYSEVDRMDESLAPSEEAVAIGEELERENPGGDLPNLALAYGNLSRALNSAGRLAEAVAAAERAVGIYRNLVATNPAVHTPYLSIALTNSGLWLAEVGRYEEALSASGEALAIRTELAEVDHEANAFYLALAQWAFANVCLQSKTRQAEGISAARQSIVLFQVLESRYPGVYPIHLGRAEETLEKLRTVQ